jgi:hypothetical protein
MMTCTACRTSSWSCPRCGDARCADHVATYRQECLDCALAYYASRDTVHMRAWYAVGAALPWLLYASVYSELPSWSERSGGFRAITTGVPALDVVLMFAFVSFFAGKAMVTLRTWWHDRVFARRELAPARVVARPERCVQRNASRS